ncbi:MULTISPECIES: Scr1 family TA system antitoxin-like transcriptional regulator [Streptomyces]|uniref:XRE family transcriptional regulator n=1 Tax=Streptomyces tsukubensis (strain DSM 42081 / NBRC 108919 / NRRL 18488 / 9993) TaxID=1114943 RepID=I2N870_STRT9|nr:MULTISPECIES: Scr1 family TA system antitoxin-like transcriptional regulator [Streptomyces]AZK97099.1 transcriptional regulator [Streptomyces tsukubensis]EIF93217.1 hypothetical protein [Streptomyces tsukubensis NRRL18488]MYS67966.1 helix-turn-helix domain-containing protein [Streptomyces sp. SID5473]QKM66930.1 XRE family transcriptional regulator [Streptomyces tsukubensis NRRL18488]TAI44723.1 XRE family transcriptional regulator [Streptomyces tsukubensis]
MTASARPRPGPVVGGAVLRAMRQAHRLTAQQLATEAGISTRALHRAETGRSTPREAPVIHRIIERYAPDWPVHACELLQLAHSSGSVRDYGTGSYDRLAALESLSGTLVLAALDTIPAPLRATGYQQALREAGDIPLHSPSRALRHPGHGKKLMVYLGEMALYQLGGPDIAAEQIDHLIGLAPYTPIHVIPWGPSRLATHLRPHPATVYAQYWFRPTPLDSAETLALGAWYPTPEQSVIPAVLDTCRTQALPRTESLDVLRAAQQHHARRRGLPAQPPADTKATARSFRPRSPAPC